MANEILIPVKYVVDDSDLTKAGQKVGALTAEEKKLEAEMNDVAAAARRQATAFNQAETAGTSAAKNTEKQYNMLGNSIGSIGTAIAGAFAVERVLSLGKAVLDITAEFQKFTAVLTTALGSQSEAQRAMLMIQNFAATTPFSVAELTESYVKLANRGLKLTKDEMTALGDIASSTGKSFDQLTEAVLDAMTGENERLKEFGITAKRNGETTAYTFKGVTTEVQNTNEAIKEYLISIGQVEGVTGSAAAISATLTGQISNLGDSFDQLLLTLGSQQTGIFSDTISFLNEMLSSVTFLLATTKQLGEKGSADAVTKYSAEIVKQFGVVAKTAKETGQDMKEALALEGQFLESALNDQLKVAEKKLKDFQKERGSLATQTKEWLDLTQQERAQNKSIEAVLAAEVALIKGKKAAIKDGQAEVLKADKEAENKRAEQAKKAAEDAAKAAEEAFKKRDKGRITYLATNNVFDKELENAEESLKKQNEAFDKNAKEQLKRTSAKIDEDKKLKDAARDQEEKDEKAHQDRVAAIKQEAVQFALFAADAFVQFQTMQSQERIAQLEAESEREQALTGDNFAARERIEKEYNEKIKKEKAEQAKREKALSLFNIAVNTATGVIKAVSESPLTFGLPFSAFILAQGAIQAALVASQPIPKFAKGTRSVTGGRPGEDSVLAMLMPGERVITTEKNRQLSPAFDVLTNSKHSPQFLNKALMEIEKLGMFVPPKLSDLSTGAGAGGLDTDRLIAAIRGIPIERTTFDERGVVRYTESQQNRIRRLNKRYGL